MRKLIPLLEACNFTMGQSPSSDTYNTSHDGMPFYQGNSDFGKRSPAPRVWCSAPKKTANEGDILISVRAPIGAINIASERCCIGRGLAAIGPLPDMVARDYLEHYLRFRKPELERQGTGSTFKAVGKKVFAEMTLPIVPMEEQTGIARRLGGVIELKEEALSQIEELDELVKSRFVEMFGDGKWPTEVLQNVADVQGGLTKNKRRESLEMQLPYLRVANVMQGELDLTEMLSIGLTEAERDKTLLQTGDMLFVEGNGSRDQIGRSAIWDGSINPCVHQNHLIRARLGERVMPVFALAYFSSPAGREQIVAKAVSTSGLFTLSTGKIKALEIPVPPLALQQEFAAFVRQVDKLKFETQQAIDKLQMLYDSLAQEYFGS